MIICLGTDGNTLDSQIAKRFGHAAYYILYNTVDSLFEPVQNIDKDNHDHKILIHLLQRGAKIFIVGNIGPYAFKRLRSGGAKIYLARKMKAIEAIEKFQKGELEELDKPTAKESIDHKKHIHHRDIHT